MLRIIRVRILGFMSFKLLFFGFFLFSIRSSSATPSSNSSRGSTFSSKMLNAEEKEIIFTASATESNVTAIMSAARNSNGKKRIITSKLEHASILETMNYLETQGFDIVYLDVDDKGRISTEDFKKAIT